MARQLNAHQLASLWVRAGGDPSKARTAAQIALAESGGRVNALNPTAPDYSVGPWQINYFGNLREPRTRQFGSPQQLMSDPLANARAAVAISQGGKDFSPWSTYTSGAYRRSRVPRSAAPLGAVPNLSKSPNAPKSSGSPFPDLTSVVLQNLGSDYSPSFQLSNLVSAIQGAATTAPTSVTPTSRTPRSKLPTFKASGEPVPKNFLTSVGVEHQTAGLPGYPAHDYMAPAGAPAVAPATGKVIKLSGHDPSAGPTEGVHGPFGWSVYIQANDGRRYYLTHMGSRDVRIGQRVKAGQQIGTVGNYAKWGGANHIHMGVE